MTRKFGLMAEVGVAAEVPELSAKAPGEGYTLLP